MYFSRFGSEVLEAGKIPAAPTKMGLNRGWSPNSLTRGKSLCYPPFSARNTCEVWLQKLSGATCWKHDEFT